MGRNHLNVVEARTQNTITIDVKILIATNTTITLQKIKTVKHHYVFEDK